MLGPALVRDAGCRANLMWRCDLARPADTAGFVDGAAAVGFESLPQASRMGLEVLAETGTGHRIVVVLRTGRVQIRLDALTDPEVRVAEGRRVFESLRRVSNAATPAGG